MNQRRLSASFDPCDVIFDFAVGERWNRIRIVARGNCREPEEAR
jgi:hypothetical protein